MPNLLTDKVNVGFNLCRCPGQMAMKEKLLVDMNGAVIVEYNLSCT